MLPMLAFTIIILAAFAIAGIFSSKIATSTGTEVLVSSLDSCGSLNSSKNVDITGIQTILYPYYSQKIGDYANYAQQCYTNLSSPEDCRKYPKKQLPWSADKNASCPYENLCKANFGNLELDSGFIKAGEELGLNLPIDEQFTYRTRLLCAPLATDGHKERYIRITGGNEIPYMRYYFGRAATSNFTCEYPEGFKELFNEDYWTGRNEDYSIG